MRLTLPLTFPQKRVWLESYAWHRWRKRALQSTGMANKLRKAGYNVEDAKELVKKDSPLFFDVDAIPSAQPVFPVIPKQDSTHPDWHNTPRKVFEMKTFVFEGVPQAQALTNSVIINKGLPSKLVELGNSNAVDYQDILVQRIIKQAYLWECSLDPLPKLRDLDIPEFNFGRKYGTLQEKKTEILLRNFLRLIESKNPEIAATRVLGSEEELRVSFPRIDGSVQVCVQPMFTLLAKDPLPAVVPAEVTEAHGLPDIYPFLSTAGINDKNIYKKEDRFAFSSSSPFPYLHTALFSHNIPGSHTHAHPRWTDARFAGTTLVYNYATALLMARRKFGNDVNGILPEPITTQVVHTTGKEFQFSVFQLNTTESGESNSSKIKNIAWITPKMNLFSFCNYESSREKFEGYNPEVFKTLMGIYLNSISTPT